MSERVEIKQMMADSGVKFGTSGARGLVTQMTDRVCAAYAQAFLEYLRESHGLAPDSTVAIAGDLRPSSPRIMTAVALAATRLGHRVEFSGFVPSPAVALRGLEGGFPAVMVTGSHIPDDRNGIKFNTPLGEITKADEEGMLARTVELPDMFDDEGALVGFGPDGARLPPVEAAAIECYRKRYLSAFPAGCLEGLHLGVYGHSAVGRDFMVELYRELGAKITPLGFSESFVPVDTEAIREEDTALALKWAKEFQLDAIVSTDGDSDRPLISDEKGRWIRGDVSGIVAARFLGAQAVATPVSCNTAVEKCGDFSQVIRTRIGSPFVIAGMKQAKADGAQGVVGYEANGGFLSLSELQVPGGASLPELPTRDATVVHLSLLLAAKREKKSLSLLFSELPTRFTRSDRDQSFATERSRALLGDLASRAAESLEREFKLGTLTRRDETDGLRFTFQEGADEVTVHLRPSGNAPELRCYAEASTEARAQELVVGGLALARRLAPS